MKEKAPHERGFFFEKIFLLLVRSHSFQELK